MSVLSVGQPVCSFKTNMYCRKSADSIEMSFVVLGPRKDLLDWDPYPQKGTNVERNGAAHVTYRKKAAPATWPFSEIIL